MHKCLHHIIYMHTNWLSLTFQMHPGHSAADPTIAAGHSSPWGVGTEDPTCPWGVGRGFAESVTCFNDSFLAPSTQADAAAADVHSLNNSSTDTDSVFR